MYKKKIIFITIMFVFVQSIFSLQWKQEKVEKISYESLSDDFFVSSKLGSLCKIEDDVYGIFTDNSYIVLNLKIKTTRTIMNKGKGPGECLSPTSLIKLEDKYICGDKSKNALIEFDSDLNFIREIKLEKSPKTILKWTKEKFVIVNSAVPESYLLDVYNANLEKIDSILHYNETEKSFSEYEKMFLYGFAQTIISNDEFYLFLQGEAKIQTANLKTGKCHLLNYEKQLDFKPVPVEVKDNGYVFMNYFIQSLNEIKNANFVMAMSNNIAKDETNYYFQKVNLSNMKIEAIEFEEYQTESFFRIIEDHKIIEFNNDEEKINVYYFKS